MLRPTWVEIDDKAIVHNLNVVRNIVGPKVKIMAVIKANAYGHGVLSVADALIKDGVNYFAVATIDEAITLREAGIDQPVLVLGTTIPGYGVDEAVQADIALALCSIELAQALSASAQQQGKTAKVHLKIDTGMNRIGVTPSQAVAFMNSIKDLPGLSFEGIFSHFSIADQPDNPYTQLQFDRFQEAIEALGKAGYTFPLRHIANSSAILTRPETHLDMVRPGCLLYGICPIIQLQGVHPLQLAYSLKSRIVYLKDVPEETFVSYALTYQTDSPKKLATIPIGFGDGYCRGLSNRAFAVVRGTRVPVVGRICMDQCMIDVTDVPEVCVGDEVAMIGGQGEAQVPLIEILRTIGALPSCCLGSRELPYIHI